METVSDQTQNQPLNPSPVTIEPFEMKTPPKTETPKNIFKRNVPLNILIILSILFVLVIGGSLSAFYYFQSVNKNLIATDTPQVSPTPFTFKAKVQYLTGSVYKIIDDRRIEVLENDILNEGDIIETDKDSRLVLSLDEGSVLRIDEESKLTLSLLTSPLSTINQESGFIFYRVNKDEAHKFEVVAGDVKIESLGTAYSVENKDEVKVKVFENKVKVLAQNSEKEVEQNREWVKSTNQIQNINQNELAKNEFYTWSLSEEGLKLTPTPAPTKTPVAKDKEETQTGSYIKLSGIATSEGVKLQWKVVGLDISKGFKVVKNLSGSPVYPGDDAQFIGAENSFYLWQLTDGKTWHFRVCQYQDGKCGVYSNEITVTANGSSSSGENSVSSITLTTNKVDDSSAKLIWSVEGSSSKGYKVLWSTNQNPVFPTRDGDWYVYLTDPGSRNYLIGELESGKTYYFRVCEYLGGSCGTYSNQTSLSF